MSEQSHTQSEDPVAEWLYLSDRAQQIYGGLIGLSDFGHWDSYFARTFDIYTRVRIAQLFAEVKLYPSCLCGPQEAAVSISVLTSYFSSSLFAAMALSAATQVRF